MPTPPLTVLPLAQDLDQEAIEQTSYLRTCGVEETGPFREAVFELTGNCELAAFAGAFLPTTLRILLILTIAWVANRVMKKLIKAFMRRVKEEGLAKLDSIRQKGPLSTTGPLDLARANMRTETIGGVLRSITTFTIWGIAVLMILGEMNINLGPLIAGAGIAGIALGFGAQRLVQDFLSGIFMLLEDQYGIGDIVDTGEAIGTIEAITLRTTRLRDIEGVVWHVPNGEIRRVGNMSQQWARTLLDVGVAYDTNVDHASAVMKRVADELWMDNEFADLILDEPVIWGLQDFGADQLTIRIVIKTVPGKQWVVARQYRARLKEAFDAEGIEIPFPQRTVWVRQQGDYSADGDASDPFTPTGSLTAQKQSSNREDIPRA
jgi:moderate conductance mechanosensitive channel